MLQRKFQSRHSVLAFFALSLVFIALICCSKSAVSTHKLVLTPLGGFTSSDSVESQALVAYVNFDGKIVDTITHARDTEVGVTYIPGVRGQAYQGGPGVYATFPASPALQNLQSFSVSLWYSLPQAAKPQPSGSQAQGGMFFLAGDSTISSGDDVGDEIMIEADIPSASQFAADSVNIRHGFNNVGGVPFSWQVFVMQSFDTATSEWVHLVITYDGGSSVYTYYENGQPTSMQGAFGDNLNPATIYNGPLPVGSGSPATQLMGNLNFNPAPPTTVYIGTWPAGLFGVSKTLGSNGCFLGAMDELRVFNIALSQKDVTGLYLNGLAGR
jgi:hypothetical protein